MPETHLHPLCRKLQGVSGIVNDHDFVARRPRFAPCCQRKHRVSACGAAGRPMGSGWNPRPLAWTRFCKTSRVQEIGLLGDSKNSWTGYRVQNKPPSSLPCLQPPSSRTGDDYYPIAPERERKTLVEWGNPWLNEVRNRMILVEDFAYICGYQPERSRTPELTGTSRDLCGLLCPGYCHLKTPSTTACCSGPS